MEDKTQDIAQESSALDSTMISELLKASLAGDKPTSPLVEVDTSSGMVDSDRRGKILSLEAEIKKLDQVDIKTEHYFADGTYLRQVFLPKGTIATGKIHKFEHINVISKGDITVYTESGEQRVKGPCIMVSPPGTKRAVYAHEDTIWANVHANASNETDLGRLESELIASSYSDLLTHQKKEGEDQPWLG